MTIIGLLPSCDMCTAEPQALQSHTTAKKLSGYLDSPLRPAMSAPFQHPCNNHHLSSIKLAVNIRVTAYRNTNFMQLCIARGLIILATARRQ
jgi:hypothetical protein